MIKRSPSRRIVPKVIKIDFSGKEIGRGHLSGAART